MVVMEDGYIHLKVHKFLKFHLKEYLEGREISQKAYLCLLVMVFVE